MNLLKKMNNEYTIKCIFNENTQCLLSRIYIYIYIYIYGFFYINRIQILYDYERQLKRNSKGKQVFRDSAVEFANCKTTCIQ
jgi:glucose-6-phosphate isomerase